MVRNWFGKKGNGDHQWVGRSAFGGVQAWGTGQVVEDARAENVGIETKDAHLIKRSKTRKTMNLRAKHNGDEKERG